MGKKLLVMEKPSVATSFANVLGVNVSKADRAKGYIESETYIITWCYGHLINMAYPDAYDIKYKQWKIEHLPIIPEEYKYIVIDDNGIKNQFNTIKTLMCRDDVDVIYCCTDSGREGEYIYRLVYEHSGSNKPAKRVWISSQTEDAIKEGIEKSKDISEYDYLAKSAYNRAKEDWLFGMNFSRIYTCQYGRNISGFLKEGGSSVIAVGRVMTCVLGLIVNRENEISNFVPQKHYGIEGKFSSIESTIDYDGKWQAEKGNKKEKEEVKYITKEQALEVINKLKGKEGLVKKVQLTTKSENPPLLFNLAELQSEANKKFKLPVDKTLEIAQSLYEKKLITYPRTDCRVISTDVAAELPKILNGLYKNSNFKNYIMEIREKGSLKVENYSKRYVDNKKVTDHYAIIPTYVTVELDKLSEDMKNIYLLIVKRFLAIFYTPIIYNTVKIETEIEKEVFTTNSRTIKDLGWKSVYDYSSKKEEDYLPTDIHNLIKKEKVKALQFNLEEKETKPPSRYTDGALIITMEKAGKFIEDEELREQIKTCGIGTSATRAGIITKLKKIGYIDIHPKTQVITPTLKGKIIVEIIRRTAKELLNPALTASWEKGLVMIENKETSEEVFYNKLCSYITRSIDKIKRNDGKINLLKILDKK